MFCMLREHCVHYYLQSASRNIGMFCMLREHCVHYYLQSASRNIGMFCMLRELPTHSTTSPYSCIIAIISHVAVCREKYNTGLCNNTVGE